jgi:hypothetical protein
VKTLSKAELDELPKLSATILEFGAPLVGDPPPNATVADLQQAMMLVEMAWNLPILTQHSKSSAGLGKDLDQRMALLPPEVRGVLEGMLRARATTYAHDPRTAHVLVERDGRGGFTVKAETRLVPGVTPK